MAIITTQLEKKRTLVEYNGQRAGVIVRRFSGDVVFVPDIDVDGLGLEFLELLTDLMQCFSKS